VVITYDLKHTHLDIFQACIRSRSCHLNDNQFKTKVRSIIVKLINSK